MARQGIKYPTPGTENLGLSFVPPVDCSVFLFAIHAYNSIFHCFHELVILLYFSNYDPNITSFQEYQQRIREELERIQSQLEVHDVYNSSDIPLADRNFDLSDTTGGVFILQKLYDHYRKGYLSREDLLFILKHCTNIGELDLKAFQSLLEETIYPANYEVITDETFISVVAEAFSLGNAFLQREIVEKWIADRDVITFNYLSWDVVKDALPGIAQNLQYISMACAAGMTYTSTGATICEGVMIITDPENREVHVVNTIIGFLPDVIEVPGLDTIKGKAAIEISTGPVGLGYGRKEETKPAPSGG